MNNQDEAFNKLSKLKVGALFMEMGTGKTKVALDLINSKINKIDYILWICPVSLKNEIEAEKLKWYPNLNLHIVGCESIGSSDRIYLETLSAIQNKNVFCVVDESLKIKNSEAKRTQRILKIGEVCKYKLILNGTPISKNVMDLWTQMQFLSPKILNMSENEFKNTFCEYYLRGKLKGVIKKQYNIEYLVSLIQPYIFESKLNIDIKSNYKNIYYSLNTEEKFEYENAKNEMLEKFDEDDNIDFYRLVTNLQQIYTKAEERKAIVDDLLNRINKLNERTIVFVKYKANIPDGEKRITGDNTLKERKEIIDDFKNDKFKTLYLTYGVGSFGLNLQFCNNIIFLDHTFDYSTKIQAEHRIYRIGQDKEIFYFNIICTTGLEKMIINNLDKKSDLLDEIKREINTKGVKEWLKNI